MNDRDLRAQEPCAQIKKRIEEARKEIDLIRKEKAPGKAAKNRKRLSKGL